MYLSVIIPTYNRNLLLSNCLKTLDSTYQSIDKSLYEVIVSDDSPGFAANVLAEDFPSVKFVEGPKRGAGANRNNGVKFAKGEWIVFIDDDCVTESDILQVYYNEILKKQYRAFEGYINADRPQARFNEVSPLNISGNCFWTCNVSIEKEFFNEIGGFDENYTIYEDIDFFTRLKKLGEAKFLVDARVIHPWRLTKAFQNFKKRVFNIRYMLNKNNVKRDFPYRLKQFKLFVGVLVTDTKNIVKFSFKGIGSYVDKICFQIVLIFI